MYSGSKVTCVLVLGFIAVGICHGEKLAPYRKLKNQPEVDLLSRSPPTKTEARCGDWHKTSPGIIYYQPFDPVVDYERCVWVIQVPGAKGYNINIQFMSESINKPGTGLRLLLTGVRHNAATAPIMTQYQP